jgi:single-stranded-DNA-specific exonuclease
MTGLAPVRDYLTCDDKQASHLAQELGISPVIGRILILRGITTPEEGDRFLHPSLDQLHDPYRMTDLAAGVDRILAAIERGERIAVHGDYDVDGVTATVILRRVIELLGGDVVHYIPERVRDGYGLQVEAIDRLSVQNVRLIVSVDCGIRSGEAAERARDVGIDLVITDHHEPEATLPPALAVINPRRHDCDYPDKDLAGVGVALKVVQALCGKTDRLGWLPAFMKLAAIGTLADVVPLRGENRVIACLGLEKLSRGPHTVGLRALLESAGLDGKKINSYEVGFVLAPRINAAGRMSTPDLATRLLLSIDEKTSGEARRLAKQLDEENLRRRKEESLILLAARQRIEADPEIKLHNILVLWGDSWHRGVIGIVAAKLADEFNRPALVLSVEDGKAHGSGRSIPGFDLLASLERCGDLFERFGGHRQAAGLVINEDRLGELRRRLTKDADAHLSPDDLRPRLAIDAPLRLGDIDGRLIEGLASLEPFGAGNKRPIFHDDDVGIVDGPHSIKGNHLRMTVRGGRNSFRAVAWRAAERQGFVPDRRTSLDIAFSLTENTYRGDTHIELSVADIK